MFRSICALLNAVWDEVVYLSESYWFFKMRHPSRYVIYSTESATLYYYSNTNLICIHVLLLL
jgi:hypothetical protein